MSRRKLSQEDRKAFFGRLRPFLPPSALHKIELAYYLAKYGHRWQTRRELGPDGEPLRYFEHLRGTALILIDEVGLIDPDLIVACLCHDALEDTRDLTPELMEHCFGPEVAGIVRLLSKKPKRGYVGRLMLGGWRPLLVKACDRLNNLRSLDLPEIKPGFRAKQVRETRHKYFPVFDRLAELAPPEHAAAVRRLCAEIRGLTDELASRAGVR